MQHIDDYLKDALKTHKKWGGVLFNEYVNLRIV